MDWCPLGGNGDKPFLRARRHRRVEHREVVAAVRLAPWALRAIRDAADPRARRRASVVQLEAGMSSIARIACGSAGGVLQEVREVALLLPPRASPTRSGVQIRPVSLAPGQARPCSRSKGERPEPLS